MFEVVKKGWFQPEAFGFSILGNSVGPAVIVSRAPPTLIELTEKQKPFQKEK